MKRANRVISVLMIPLLLLLQISPALAKDASPQTVYIADADDLLALSKSCSLDSWSHGRTVILTADIDLEARDFTPIPIFGGVFDGQGHSISGLSINVEGAKQGLFRYLEQSGVIRNLEVKGVVTPGGEKSYIGGIVGNNMGTLESCSFSGYVKGKGNVGGLVGWNGTTGKLVKSSASGVVYGESKVGGVAGSNAGTILRCVNNSQVNTTVEEHKLNFEGLTMEDVRLSKLFLGATDIGGITGLNTGVVQNSENHGVIGYPHVGYNVGGVAGRQSGYITTCVNHGSVYGRKEVGGIVGQIEPYIASSIPPSKLRDLQKELQNLQSLITKLLSDTESSSDAINENLSSIEGDLDTSRAHAESLINQTEVLLNKDVEAINSISVTAIEVVDRLMPIMKDLTDTMEIANKALYSIRTSLRYLAHAMGELDKLSDQYNKLAYALTQLLEAKHNMEQALAYLLEALESLYAGESKQVWCPLLRAALDSLCAARKNIKEAVANLEAVAESIPEIMKTLGVAGNDMRYAFYYLQSAIELLGEAMERMPTVLRGVSDLLDYLRKQPQLEFATTDDQYQQTKEDLFRSIGNVSNSVFQLIDVINREGNRLIGDIQEVSDQIFLVFDLLLSIVQEITEGEIDPRKIMEDVSRKDVDGKIEGKVSSSKNFGTVEGDVNVGGIAGAMAIEFVADAEEELSIKNKPSLRAVFQTRAILSNCENAGVIVGKKHGVGGIVGNMDLGYIKACVGAGSVESTDGNYVGGIAGKANGPIHASYAKLTLQGGNYVGGIAGLGQEISNCYSMVIVNSGRACVGAIAGYVENNSAIRNNYFVSDVLAGIDGISYAKRAEPIAYEALLAVKGLPAIFRQLKLTFWVDDRLLDTIEVKYGDSISEADLPQLPAKEGHYARWEKFDLANITFDRKVKAEYFPYVSILESKEKRDGPLAIVLVEGSFTEEDALTLVGNKRGRRLFPEHGDFLEQWSITIPEDGNPPHTLRFIPPAKQPGLLIYVLENGEWVKTNARWDGKYMVFRAGGNSATFALVKGKPSYGAYWAALGLLAVVITVFVILRRRKVVRATGR